MHQTSVWIKSNKKVTQLQIWTILFRFHHLKVTLFTLHNAPSYRCTHQTFLQQGDRTCSQRSTCYSGHLRRAVSAEASHTRRGGAAEMNSEQDDTKASGHSHRALLKLLKSQTHPAGLKTDTTWQHKDTG